MVPTRQCDMVVVVEVLLDHVMVNSLWGVVLLVSD